MLKSIMLIDDDSNTNLYHQIIIEESELVEELIICTSVDEAINKLLISSQAPDLIFLDINMPKKNAWDFLKEYEENISNKISKIIILSTTKSPSDVVKAEHNNNVSSFMTKPLDLDFIKSYSKNISQ